MRDLPVLTVALLGALAAAPSLSAQKRMTPELLWQLRRVGDPQLGPDGKQLLYHVRTYDLEANAGTTQVYLLDLESGGPPRQLTGEGSNSNARWSPDGRLVALVSSRGGSPQIWVVDPSGGEPRQVTDHEGGVANMSWSPTGEHFAFTADVKLDPDVHDMFPDLPKAEARIYDDLLVRHWDVWKDGTYSHLFVVPAAGGEAVDLMEGQRVDTPLKPFGGGEQIAWSPDGKELCYTAKRVANPESSTNSDLYVVPVDGGAHRSLTEGMPGYEMEPVYSPDGKMIAFHSMARAGYESDRNRLMVHDRQSGLTVEVLPDFDASVHGTVWSPDSRRLWFTVDTLGTTQVFGAELKGEGARQLTSGRWQFGSLQPAPDGRTLYALRQRTERPWEVVRIALGADGGVGAGSADGEAITDENGAIYADLELPAVEEEWFEVSDGARVHSWIVYPPDFDREKKWPLLLYCQGGPQSMVGQWFSYRWNFHLMAAQGYIVAAVNRRGLPGFGRKWNEDISRDWGGRAMLDLVEVTDAMQARPYVDRERTGAVGASFGGYTIYWLMGHDQQDRFCTMIAHCGVFHLESMYLSTEELFFVNWDLGGPYWKSPEVAADYQRFSPHRFVQHWDTPLLVIHGEKDFRVPYAQGLQAFTAAQVQGVPSRFLYFPEEGHWVLSPQNGVLWHRVFFGWLDRWCK